MNEKTILVIDDSSTIRRLVDNELSSAGYRVIMAATAEDGLAMAADEQPDLILLDHQLPGVTGYDVCCKLNSDPTTKLIPVVCSSTLRKKAYAEYTELDNVIDMLPKPYTPDLLRMIVANALETAALIVSSQSGGTAVPEVINEQEEGDLQGTFGAFGLREVIDFLNNGEKRGALEIDLGRSRVSVHLGNGRIQAISASGTGTDLITDCLPDLIRDLAPMVKFTIRGQKCSEVDGLVELLDNKVLDSRLLKQLLKHQAAVLLGHCHRSELKGFRFSANASLPSLYNKLPLETSLLALMVESSLLDTPAELPESELNKVAYVRCPQRGQNLDRGGLGAGHLQLLNLVSTPASISELGKRSNLPPTEIYAVLNGFVSAELVSKQEQRQVKIIIAVTGQPDNARKLGDCFRSSSDRISGKVVRDLLAIKLLLRRVRPDALLVDLECEKASRTLSQLLANCPDELSSVRWIGISHDAVDSGHERVQCVVWPELDHELEPLIQSALQDEVVDCA